MSKEYTTYLTEHIANAQKAGKWLISHFPDILSSEEKIALATALTGHDGSKWGPAEYDAYDTYFYGGNKSHKVVSDFNYAWLHHIHNNPHHWQYWILQHDDEPEEILEMPKGYAVEMIADWWSFSFKSGNLRDIFDWYEKHKEMKLHPKTRKFVEDTLERIKDELEKEKEKENGHEDQT